MSLRQNGASGRSQLVAVRGMLLGMAGLACILVAIFVALSGLGRREQVEQVQLGKNPGGFPDMGQRAVSPVAQLRPAAGHGEPGLAIVRHAGGLRGRGTASEEPRSAPESTNEQGIPGSWAEPVISDAEISAAILRDERASFSERANAAGRLARFGGEAGVAELQAVFSHAEPQLRAAIARALGSSALPGAKRFLLEILDREEDERVLRGAVRGLSLLGGADVVEALSRVLDSERTARNVRMEAAEGLGTVGGSQAVAALLRAYTELGGQDAAIGTAVLQGLGACELSETRVFFEKILADAGQPRHRRVAALEAVSRAKGEVGNFLIKYARDSDPEVRSAALWSLAMAQEPGRLVPELTAILDAETHPMVREKAYLALENQEDLDPAAAIWLAEAEWDFSARLSAYGLVASEVSRIADTGEKAEWEGLPPEAHSAFISFEETIVPKLLQAALEAPQRADRMRAVLALSKARTLGAKNALRAIVERSRDTELVEAVRAELETKE